MLSGWFTLPFPVTFCIHCRALCKQTHWPFCSWDSFMDSQEEIYVYVLYHAHIQKYMIATFLRGMFNQKLPILKLQWRAVNMVA